MKILPRNIINIDVNNFWRGASTTDFLPDGGYSSEDKGHNLYISKGLLWPQPKEINQGALSSLGIVASDFNNDLNPDFRGVVADNGDGYFYTFTNVGVPTLIATDTGKTYSAYNTDMIFYNGSFFVSSKTDITKLDKDMGGYDNDWWTTVAGGASLSSYLPHQMIEFNNILYIADDNVLKSWDGSVKSDSAFDLSSQYKITAIVNYQNKIYIAAELNYNAGGTSHNTSKLFVWDGTSSSWDNEYFLPEKVFTLIDYNGQLLVFGAFSIYLWNGISSIKIFDIPDDSSPIYKQKITKFKNRLYFANGNYIIIYDGQKFSYLYDTGNSSGDIFGKEIKSLGFVQVSGDKQTAIMTGYNDSYELDFNNNGGHKDYTGSSYWRSNRYELPQNNRIIRAFVELGEDLEEVGAEMVFSIIDERGNETTIGSMLYDSGDRRVKDFRNLSIPALSFQARVRFKTYPKSLKRILIYYEPSEQSIKQS